jgi:hypothetical protein
MPNPIDILGSTGLLAAMITPSVLISASGTLIFSTATRLARNVDRVRNLAHQLESLWAADPTPETAERVHEVEALLAISARRSHLIQTSLTSFYLALGLFVATTVSIGLTALIARLEWLPGLLGLAGTLVLFVGCLQLIREARMALDSVDREMRFVLDRGARRKAT